MLLTWALILVGIALIPFWWRELRQEDLEIDRSLQPGDAQVTDRTLLEEKAGLLAALQQLAQHVKLVYGMNVKVEVQHWHALESPGQRLLLFQSIEDWLLYLARHFKLARMRVVLSQREGYHWVELVPEASINFESPPPRAVSEIQPLFSTLLERTEERMYQIEGYLKIEPDRRSARRIILTSAIEFQANA